MSEVNSVVETAVERTSWGKSRCELIGLHDTSGDAPLETPTLQNPVPVWCHVHKSNSSSSKRTQVAAVTYEQILHHPVKHSTKHKRSLNVNRKCHKQNFKLKDVVVGNGILTPNRLSLNYIRNNVVVCNGGATDLDAIKGNLVFTIFEYVRVIYGYVIPSMHP